MSQLVPCIHCDRHVRVAETRCPFCQGALAGEPAAAARAGRGRMSRAAMLAVGATLATAPAACDSDGKTGNDAAMSDDAGTDGAPDSAPDSASTDSSPADRVTF